MTILDALRTNCFNYLDLLAFAGAGIAIGIDAGISIMVYRRKKKAKEVINKRYGYFTYADRVYADTDSIKATK